MQCPSLVRSVVLLSCLAIPARAQSELPESLQKAAAAFHDAYGASLRELWAHLTEPQQQDIAAGRSVLAELRAKPDLSKADLAGPGQDAFALLRKHLLPELSWVRRHFRDVVRTEGRLEAQRGLLERFAHQHDLSMTAAEWRQMNELLGEIRGFFPDDYPAIWQSVQDALGDVHADELINVLDLDVRRGLSDLPPITTVDTKLVAAARDHSNDMQKLGFFSHTSPVEGKTTFVDRAHRFGAEAGGENLHRGNTDPLLANDAWCHSPGHFKTMFLKDWHRIGVGQVAAHWTALFGR